MKTGFDEFDEQGAEWGNYRKSLPANEDEFSGSTPCHVCALSNAENAIYIPIASNTHRTVGKRYNNSSAIIRCPRSFG